MTRYATPYCFTRIFSIANRTGAVVARLCSLLQQHCRMQPPGPFGTATDDPSTRSTLDREFGVPNRRVRSTLLFVSTGLAFAMGAGATSLATAPPIPACATLRMSVLADPVVVFEGNQGQAVFTVKNTSFETPDCDDVPLGFQITGINLGDGGIGFHSSDSIGQDNPLDDILTSSKIPAVPDKCSGKTLNEGATCTFVQQFSSDDLSTNRDHDDSGYWSLTNIVKATAVFDGTALQGDGKSIVIVTDIAIVNPEPATLTLFTASGLLIAAGTWRRRKRVPQ